MAIKLGSHLALANNNPGNLRYAGQQGATPGKNNFARFETPEAGYQALKNQINLDASKGHTVESFITKYAPPIENDTALYIKQASDNLGVDPSAKLSDLDVNKIAKFMAQKESGTTTSTFKVKFDTGQTVIFDRKPSQMDIEEVAQKMKLSKQPETPTQPQTFEEQHPILSLPYTVAKGVAKTFTKPIGEAVSASYELAGEKSPEWTENLRMASPEVRALGKYKGGTPEYQQEVSKLKSGGAEGAGFEDVLNSLMFLPAGKVATGIRTLKIPKVAKTSLEFAKWGGAFGTAKALDEGKTWNEAVKEGLISAGTSAILPFGWKAGTKIIGETGKLALGMFGRLTDVGSQTLAKAYDIFKNGTQEAREALVKSMKFTEPQAEESVNKLWEKAETGFKKMKSEKSAQYQKRLAEIQEDTQLFPIQDIKDEATKLSDMFRVEKRTGGKIWDDVQYINQIIQDWGKDPRDYTAVGLDLLKQVLDDFYSNVSPRLNSFTTQLKNKIRSKIIEKIPEYATMESEYRVASELEKDVIHSLGVGATTKNKETALNKLLNVYKKASNDERQRVLTELEKYMDGNFSAEIVGRSLRQIVSEGLAGKLASVYTGLSIFVSPYMATGLILTSPKLLGNTMRILGFSARMKDKLKNAITEQLLKTGKYTPKIIDDIFGKTTDKFQTTVPSVGAVKPPPFKPTGLLTQGSKIGTPENPFILSEMSPSTKQKAIKESGVISRPPSKTYGRVPTTGRFKRVYGSLEVTPEQIEASQKAAGIYRPPKK